MEWGWIEVVMGGGKGGGLILLQPSVAAVLWFGRTTVCEAVFYSLFCDSVSWILSAVSSSSRFSGRSSHRRATMVGIVPMIWRPVELNSRLDETVSIG